MARNWCLVLVCCAVVTAHVVLLQPSIGYVYPPQIVQAPSASQQHEGYYYSAPPPPPQQNPVRNQVQGGAPAFPPEGVDSAFGYGGATADQFPQEAQCLLVASAGNSVSGELRLWQSAPGAEVRVEGTVYGLRPGLHGFHLHRDGDLSDDCKAAGPHFNPGNQTHGAPESAARHAGDLGNIVADASGVASVETGAAFGGGLGDAVGRAMVVHEREDDLGRGGDEESLRTGNAGKRLACCRVTALGGAY